MFRVLGIVVLKLENHQDETKEPVKDNVNVETAEVIKTPSQPIIEVKSFSEAQSHFKEKYNTEENIQ